MRDKAFRLANKHKDRHYPLKSCSCIMCMNPRRNKGFGNKEERLTMAERRALSIPVEENINET